jgi:hypothetical protein
VELRHEPEYIDTAHELWLELRAEFGAKFHHRDVVWPAMRRMKHDLYSKERPVVLYQIESELFRRV